MCTSPPIRSPDVLWMGMEMIQDGPDLMRRSGTNQQLGGHTCNILKNPIGSSSQTPKLQYLCCVWFSLPLGHIRSGATSQNTVANMFGVLVPSPSRAEQPYTIGSFAQTKICQYHIAIFNILRRIVSWLVFSWGTGRKQCETMSLHPRICEPNSPACLSRARSAIRGDHVPPINPHHYIALTSSVMTESRFTHTCKVGQLKRRTL